MTLAAAAAAQVEEDPLLGTRLADRYRLVEKIGEGGMGAVYRGVHEALRKTVAVKVLHGSARADRELVTRFEREAIAAANLKHPNIVEATDFGQTQVGILFIVMEFVEGQSLRSLLAREGRLAPARAMHLLRQVGSALSFAHSHDVVHRDLKPENIVVFDRGDERDMVKVIDFGIARVRKSFGVGPTSLTRVGSVFGTADYMAPEQGMGQTVDARADQYALGVIAFELFAGRRPYASDDVASLVFMHVGAPIPRVTERTPNLPAALDDVIAQMMGKLPDERFPSLSDAMTALARAVEQPAPASAAALETRAATPMAPTAPSPRFGSGGTIVYDAPAQPPSPVHASAGAQLSRDGVRRRVPLVLLAAMVVACAIGLAAILLVLFRDHDQPSAAPPIAASYEPPTLAPATPPRPAARSPGHRDKDKDKDKGKGRSKHKGHGKHADD